MKKIDAHGLLESARMADSFSSDGLFLQRVDKLSHQSNLLIPNRVEIGKIGGDTRIIGVDKFIELFSASDTSF